MLQTVISQNMRKVKIAFVKYRSIPLIVVYVITASVVLTFIKQNQHFHMLAVSKIGSR